MVAIASRARTPSTLAAAGIALGAVLAMKSGPSVPPVECLAAPRAHADDGLQLAAGRLSHGAGDHVVVTIKVPDAEAPVRPPLSVAIVIDRSKSMSGEPWEHARAAASRLVSKLDAGDAFTVIAYSDEYMTVVPMVRATAVNKDLARWAIAELALDNGTCISCGISRGAEQLDRTPLSHGVRRMVLISDGYANLGIRDRDELVQLAADVAARGISITAVGVGRAFDEQTMMRIAEVGHGNYHYVEDTGEPIDHAEHRGGLDYHVERMRKLEAALLGELAGVARTVATDVRLTVRAAPGMTIERALGHTMAAAGDTVSIPIEDLRAGQVRKVVLRVSGAAPCPLVASLTWRRPIDGAGRSALALEGPVDAIHVGAPDPGDAGTLELALAGEALERAAIAHGSRGPAAAQRLLQDYQAELERERKQRLRWLTIELPLRLSAAADAFGAAAGGGDGDRALKLVRETSYRLGRGQL